MGVIPITCPTCGREASIGIGQEIFGNELVWWAAERCGSCGYCTEADGKDLPPTEYRNAILKADGTWELILDSIPSIANVAHSLRRIFSLSLQDAINAARKAPGAVASGTKTEMEYACQQLMTEGIPARVAMTLERTP